jgi:hypothetical protein
MAAQDFETLRARVQAFGCLLFVDDADDGDPRHYVHDPKLGKHVLVGVPADEVDAWCSEPERLSAESKEAEPKPETEHMQRTWVFYTDTDAQQAITSIRGIVQTLESKFFTDLDEDVQGLVWALKLMVEPLYAGAYAVPPDVSIAVRGALRKLG